MKYRYVKSKVYLLAVGVIVVAFLWNATVTTLDWALKREARLVGMDWAHHMEGRLADLTLPRRPNGSRDVTALPNPDELRRLLSSVFSIGHVFQFDYINADCHCHVSLTNSTNATAPIAVLTNVPGHTVQTHAGPIRLDDLNTPTPPNPRSDVEGSMPEDLWKHVAAGGGAHGAPRYNASDAYQHPINYNLVGHIITQQSHDIHVRRGASADVPETFAEVYYPVVRGGEVLYLMRLLVNLEEQAVIYAKLLAIAAGITALLITGCVGYPTWRYIVAAARQRQADKRVSFLANHDVLTNLYNRNNFQESFSDIIWQCHERRQSALMFVFDLNDFKDINDYYGHPTGDKILCEFASLLKRVAPDNSYIARLGGDEFVVVIHGIAEKDPDYRDYLDVPDAVTITLNAGKQTIASPIAGGVVSFPKDAETVEELVQLADLALYVAKPHRTGKICAFEPRFKEEFFDRLKIRDEFRTALAQSQIEPYYQPIVNMHTEKVEGFEALARWIHPEKGVLTPFVFAEVLEDGEISALLGQQMFQKIADEMADWHRASLPFVKVALNVTDGDLKPPGFADDLLAGLAARGLVPENLTIEVTENCLFGSEKAQSMAHLTKLRTAGCAIALDDFGTGYSSITQLKELPITAIKIDKSFIDNVLEDHADQSIIGAMIELGQSMNFSLVMEGIETASQLSFLKRMGSELAQGYYYARPMPATEVPAYIQRQNAQYDEAALKRIAG